MVTHCVFGLSLIPLIGLILKANVPPTNYGEFMKNGLLSALVLLTLVLFPYASANAQEMGRVSRIQIEGAERIDPETILSYMTVQPGDSYGQETLSESAKALYGTGLFADVNIQPRNGVLVVSVVENPLINQIAFEGNEKLKDEELQAEVASRPRNVLARTTVQSDVDRIQELYRRAGRYSVAVDPKVIRLDQNRVNLVFEINEGPVSEIQGVKFVGNEAFSDDSLREVIASKEERWYRFLSTSDRYDPDRLAYDQELLRRFYLKEGYVDFRVASAVAELTPDKEAFYVTFTVEEGPRYKVGNVSVDTSALKDADPALLEKDLEIKAGKWYDAEAVDDTVTKMTDTLGDLQYAFVAVQPDVQRNVDAQTVDITFRAANTPKVYVERIDIKGNVRTQDKVIRREFDLVEGDAFNKTKLAKAEQDLKDLDFFDQVKVRPVQGSSPDRPCWTWTSRKSRRVKFRSVVVSPPPKVRWPTSRSANATSWVRGRPFRWPRPCRASAPNSTRRSPSLISSTATWRQAWMRSTSRAICRTSRPTTRSVRAARCASAIRCRRTCARRSNTALRTTTSRTWRPTPRASFRIRKGSA